jgi:hypothetical protein
MNLHLGKISARCHSEPRRPSACGLNDREKEPTGACRYERAAGRASFWWPAEAPTLVVDMETDDHQSLCVYQQRREKSSDALARESNPGFFAAPRMTGEAMRMDSLGENFVLIR